MNKLAFALSGLAMALLFSSCASPYREAGRLEIQVKLEQADVFSEPMQEAWFELVFVGGRSYASTFASLMPVKNPDNIRSIENMLWSGDLYGNHTAYLLIYANGYGDPDTKGNPQVVPLELKRDTSTGDWSEWMVPCMIENSGNDAGWNIIYQTRQLHYIPLDVPPLGKVRFRIINNGPNNAFQAIGDKSPQPER